MGHVVAIARAPTVEPHQIAGGFQAGSRHGTLVADQAVIPKVRGQLWSQCGDPAVADAFCASRLGGDWAGTFGTLPAGVDVEAIVRRTTPAV